MKNGKQGFEEEPVDGSVEITDEHYSQLLAGQSAGLLIVESTRGYPILVVYEATIEEIRVQKLDELRLFDSSQIVNQFSIDNVFGWLNKSTRVVSRWGKHEHTCRAYELNQYRERSRTI